MVEVLTGVNLEFCKDIVDEDLVPLRGLSFLCLNALHKLSDAAVVDCIARSGPTLRQLELYWHHALGNLAIVSAAKVCPRLTELNLSGCQQLEDSGARAVARHCPLLTSLDLTRCPLLSDDALEVITPHASNGNTAVCDFCSQELPQKGYYLLASYTRTASKWILFAWFSFSAHGFKS